MKPIKNVDFEFIIMYPVYSFDEIHRKAAIMTMYEAHRCPDPWVKKLNSMKLPIFAPSEFVRKMFIDSGVKVPVQHLELGVNSTYYVSRQRTYPTDRPFRFLTMGKLEPRKNVEVALSCFEQAFFEYPNVEFIIKTRERFLPSSVKFAAQKDKRIKIIEKTITEDELRKLFYHCDAFVYPSRGEGFAFPPRHAVATGLPTLVTDWSALSEIAGAIKIATDDMSPMPPCGFSYGDHDKMLMANVDELDLIYTMQDLVGEPEFYNKVAKLTYGIRQFTWQDCAKRLIKLVEEM